jgi:tungstate transport system ATP-binding protein
MLDRVGMGAFAPARADHLSGGETQRVAMARALACAPQVILLDEPTANVDVENHAAIEGIIQDMRKSGTSVILTTHDAGQAARLADERIHLFEGRVTEDPLGNVLTIQIVQQNGGFVGRLADGLEMPLDRGPERTARVSLNPRLLSLVAWEPQDSKPSGWDGRVVELASEGNDVRLKVDVGRPFSVLWPRDRFQTQPLGLGDRVRLSAPPQALEFLS